MAATPAARLPLCKRTGSAPFRLGECSLRVAAALRRPALPPLVVAVTPSTLKPTACMLTRTGQQLSQGEPAVEAGRSRPHASQLQRVSSISKAKARILLVTGMLVAVLGLQRGALCQTFAPSLGAWAGIRHGWCPLPLTSPQISSSQRQVRGCWSDSRTSRARVCGGLQAPHGEARRAPHRALRAPRWCACRALLAPQDALCNASTFGALERLAGWGQRPWNGAVAGQ